MVRASQPALRFRLWDVELALFLDQFRQYPATRFRMDKRDAPTVRPGAGHRIDQAYARRLQTFQSRIEIRHRVRDMMHPLAALDQIARDRTFRICWSNQFDPARAGAKRGNFNRLLGQHEALTVRKSKRLVTRQRLVEVGHDNCHVMQSGILERGISFVASTH